MLYKRITTISKVYWGDEQLIYHHRSGDTFLFEAVPEILLNYCLEKETFHFSDLFDVLNDITGDKQQKEAYLHSFIEKLLGKNLFVACDS